MAYLIINALALIATAVLSVVAVVAALAIAGSASEHDHEGAETIVAIDIGFTVVYAIVIGKSLC